MGNQKGDPAEEKVYEEIITFVVRINKEKNVQPKEKIDSPNDLLCLIHLSE